MTYDFLPGCPAEGAAEGAMLLNSINTELLCGKPKRRPVKILFHPSSEQDSLEDCGDQIKLVKRNSQSVFDFQFVIEGDFGCCNNLIFTGNTSEREPVILRANRSTVLSFDMDKGDVGGTLAVELAIYNTKVTVAMMRL